MSNIQIALIEDDEILSKVVAEELGDAGFQVHKAKDGESGVKLVESKKPDLVLLDIMMPKVDGFGVLKSLKDHPELQKIPVIVMTMMGRDEDIKKGLSLGADDYLVKSQHAIGEICDKVKEFFSGESHPEANQDLG